MDLSWLLPALTASGLTALLAAALLFLSRNLITTRLTAAVKHEYDERMANLEASLQRKQSSIEALRENLLSGISARRAASYDRRQSAIEALWAAVVAQGPSKGAFFSLSVIDADSNDPAVWKSNKEGIPHYKLQGDHAFTERYNVLRAAEVHRPFVEPKIWILYTTYCAIVDAATVCLRFVSNGGRALVSWKHRHDLHSMIRTTVPRMFDDSMRDGYAGIAQLLIAIESDLAVTMHECVDGRHVGDETLKQLVHMSEWAERAKLEASGNTDAVALAKGDRS